MQFIFDPSFIFNLGKLAGIDRSKSHFLLFAHHFKVLYSEIYAFKTVGIKLIIAYKLQDLSTDYHPSHGIAGRAILEKIPQIY